MTFKSLSLAIATTALVTVSAPLFAQDKTGPNVNTAAAGKLGGAATYAMAQNLYILGMANKDPLTVLTAAKLAASVELKDGPAVKKETKGDGVDDGATGPDGPVGPETMYAAAKELAVGDDTLLGLIADAETEGTRGRIGGSVRHLSRLPGGNTDVWEIPFFGDSYAEVAIIGDGDSNLDALITDENGNTICYDVSYSDKITCSFVPSWNGYFYITVQNQGRSRNSYYLLTN